MMKKKDVIPEEVEKIRQEADEWKNKYLRALADYQNLEKRIIQDRQDQIKYAAQKIIGEFLLVLDTLENAQIHLKDQGLTLAVKEFVGVFERNGVGKIEVLHKQFDPVEMECIEIVEGPQDEVVSEVRAGYRLYDKVIRVARVKVGKGKENSEEEKLIHKE
jgi:molecular chaperone GrpE